MLLLMLIATPGFVDVEGGVAQDADTRVSLGWRCEPDAPLHLVIEGKALMYVEVLLPRLIKSPKLTLENGGRPVILDGVPGFEKMKKPTKTHRAQTDFALEVPDGPQPYTFTCPPGALVKLISVEKVTKKIAVVR